MAAEPTTPSPIKDKFYQAMLQRRSVRRFEKALLAEPTLNTIRSITEQVIGLIDENRFTCELRETKGLNLADVVGSYGRIVNPPHFFIPYLIGEKHLLTDLGFRAQQIVIHLTSMGFGSCYLGTIGRQEEVKQSLGLPSNAVIGALVIFGYPSANLGGRAVNALIHSMAGAENKLPIEKICFENSFDQPLSPSSTLLPIIEAARRAPSAVNAQPWRFLVDQQTLYLFVNRDNERYGTNQVYRYYDAGIGMAHIYLALKAMNRSSEWELIDKEKDALPLCPDSLEPLARIEI